MPWKERTVEKLYWSIGEVAEDLGVNTSLIRYWEKEFGNVKPRRSGKGDRVYTKKDIEELRRIQHLVKEKGFTLQGAREQLRRNDQVEAAPVMDVEQLRDRLLKVRADLVALATDTSSKPPAQE